MATLKLKKASPYVQPTPQPPPEDYLYKIYEDNLALKSDGCGRKAVNVAIFGIGHAATIHLSILAHNPRVKIIYVVDDIESKWLSFQTYWFFHNTQFSTSKQSDIVYKDVRVDVVIVASPTFTPEEIVLESLKTKTAVFCEKPIAETHENSVKCYETAKIVEKLLFCAFNRRFDQSYSAVRQKVLRGEVGHVQLIKVCSRDSPLPFIEYLKTSGEIFHDCMIVVQAHAHIPEIKEINDYDTVAATFHFPSGMITVNNEQPIHSVQSQYALNGLKTAPIWYSFASRFFNTFRTEMEHFLDIVQGKTKSIVKHKEILAVSRIATACEESARTGKLVELRWEPNDIPKKE